LDKITTEIIWEWNTALATLRGQQQDAAILDECIKEYESMKGP